MDDCITGHFVGGPWDGYIQDNINLRIIQLGEFLVPIEASPRALAWSSMPPEQWGDDLAEFSACGLPVCRYRVTHINWNLRRAILRPEEDLDE